MRWEPFRPTDTAVDELVRLRNAVTAHDTPDLPPMDAHVYRAFLTHHRPDHRMERWVTRVGGVLVGFADLVLPQETNRRSVHGLGFVHPEYRGRGIGSEVLRQMDSRREHAGRDRLLLIATRPRPDGTITIDNGSTALMERHGLRPALTMSRYRLDLATVSTLDPDFHSDYRPVSWRNRADDRLVADLADLETRLQTDAPRGSLEWEAQRFTVADWRAAEDLDRDRLRRVYFTGARHRATGRLAAYTAVRVGSPGSHGFQATTVVLPEHRGRGIGMAVKRANLRHIHDAEPDLRYIDTTTADDNPHMIAVNDRLGYTPCEAEVHFQGTIS